MCLLDLRGNFFWWRRRKKRNTRIVGGRGSRSRRRRIAFSSLPRQPPIVIPFPFLLALQTPAYIHACCSTLCMFYFLPSKNTQKERKREREEKEEATLGWGVERESPEGKGIRRGISAFDRRRRRERERRESLWRRRLTRIQMIAYPRLNLIPVWLWAASSSSFNFLFLLSPPPIMNSSVGSVFRFVKAPVDGWTRGEKEKKKTGADE